MGTGTPERIDVRKLVIEDVPSGCGLVGEAVDVRDILTDGDYVEMAGWGLSDTLDLESLKVAFYLDLLYPERDVRSMLCNIGFEQPKTDHPYLLIRYQALLGHFNFDAVLEKRVRSSEHEIAIKTLIGSASYIDSRNVFNLAFYKMLRPELVDELLGPGVRDAGEFTAPIDRVRTAAQMRLVYAGRDDEGDVLKKLGIDRSFWQREMPYVASLKAEGAWDLLAEHAAYLRILAAHKVEVAGGRVNLVMDKPNHNIVVPVPQARRF